MSESENNTSQSVLLHLRRKLSRPQFHFGRDVVGVITNTWLAELVGKLAVIVLIGMAVNDFQ